MAEYLELDSELTTLGPDGLKLHELDILEAIARESLVIRDPDETVRFTVRATADIIDEYDVVAAETTHSGVRIMSGSTLHGLAILWDLYEDVIMEIESMRVPILRGDNPVMRRQVSSTNRSTYTVAGHLTPKTIILPVWGTEHATKIAKTLFLSRGTIYQVCMAYSLWTRDKMPLDNRLEFQQIIRGFSKHVAGQSELFEVLAAMQADPPEIDLGCVKRHNRFERMWDGYNQK